MVNAGSRKTRNTGSHVTPEMQLLLVNMIRSVRHRSPHGPDVHRSTVNNILTAIVHSDMLVSSKYASVNLS